MKTFEYPEIKIVLLEIENIMAESDTFDDSDIGEWN